MKSLLLCLLVLLGFQLAWTQNSKSLIYEKGDKVYTKYFNCVSTMDIDYVTKVANASDSKREKMVAKFNEKVMNGEMDGASGELYTEVYSVKEFEDGGKYVIFRTESDQQGKWASAYFANDTVFLNKRSLYPTWYANGKDTTGYLKLGVEKIDMNLKVGDALEPYEDVVINFPQKSEFMEKYKVFSGYKVTSDIEEKIEYDPDYGKTVTNTYLVTRKIPQYIEKEAKVNAEWNFTNYVLNNAVSNVVATEDFVLDGKTYTAYIIESETWSKSTVDGTYYSENSEVNKKINDKKNAAKQDKTQSKIEKKMQKMGMLNADGFNVVTKKLYFVPELGVVKMVQYDSFGHIILYTVLDSIKPAN